MKVVGALILVSLATAGQANTVSIKLPGDRVEASFPGRNAKDVSGALALACDDRRWQVAERSEFAVKCQGEERGSVFNRYVREYEHVTFTLVERDNGTVVRVSAGTTSTNAFGRKSEGIGWLDYQAKDVLEQVGATFPAGTVIEGNDLGVYGYDSVFFVVTAIKPGSAAEAAGIMIGDEIWGVGGKTVSDKNALDKRFTKLIPGSVVQLEVRRGKKSIFLPVDVRAAQSPGQ